MSPLGFGVLFLHAQRRWMAKALGTIIMTGGVLGTPGVTYFWRHGPYGLVWASPWGSHGGPKLGAHGGPMRTPRVSPLWAHHGHILGPTMGPVHVISRPRIYETTHLQGPINKIGGVWPPQSVSISVSYQARSCHSISFDGVCARPTAVILSLRDSWESKLLLASGALAAFISLKRYVGRHSMRDPCPRSVLVFYFCIRRDVGWQKPSERS
jgi:hypothetical protein